MNNKFIENSDSLISLLKNEDNKAMELIFDVHYKPMVLTAYSILKDDNTAKDVVQDVFFNLWVKREKLDSDMNLKAYLKTAVRNKCIDLIRKNKRSGRSVEITDFNQPSHVASSQQQLEHDETLQVIYKAIEKLPERCKLIFSLSRFDNLSHKEIAEKLEISKKTIENQMTKALKAVRAALVSQIDLILWFFLFWIAFL